MNRVYEVAGHRFGVAGERLCRAVGSLDGFGPFAAEDGDVLFSFAEGTDVPGMEKALYELSYEDITGVFGRSARGFMMSLKPEKEESLTVWHDEGEKAVLLCGNLSGQLLRFAMWVGLGLMVLPYDTVAVHGSCVVHDGKAVLFLGESGTGKSTHTRLWVENIEGAFLLNDDSPFLRVEDGKVWAYGSPWSGKTPCYRQERYELKGCVRLAQAGANVIRRLGVLEAYGAIHPSCPPEFAYDEGLYDHVGRFIGKVITGVACCWLDCLPDREAALVAFEGLTKLEL